MYTLLFGCLVANRRVRDASPFLLGGVAVAALIDLHSFPLMAWYTSTDCSWSRSARTSCGCRLAFGCAA